MKFLNLTPHAITDVLSGRTFPPSGEVARVAASRVQAALFLKRLKAALYRAPLVEQVFAAAKPQTWELHWQQPEGPDTDDNDTFGASTGSNGWRCD